MERITNLDYIEEVLKEMFKRVKEKYTKTYTASPEWFRKRTWTSKQQEDFIEWLTNYLYSNANARRAIMRYPSKNKKACNQTAIAFIFQYGWMVDDLDDLDDSVDSTNTYSETFKKGNDLN